MTCALIVGIPSQYLRRLNDYRKRKKLTLERDSWRIKFIPSPKSTITFRLASVWQELKTNTQGCHIYAFRSQTQNTEKLRIEFDKYYRFVWLQNEWLRFIPSQIEIFIAKLMEFLDLENYWIEKVKPKSERSPLFLPEASFLANRLVSDMWTFAREPNEGDNVDGMVNKINSFTQKHLYHYGHDRIWRDQNKLHFRPDQSGHGIAEFPNNQKYSKRIPDGFHFDVNSNTGNSISIVDGEGKQHVNNPEGHFNIDPHGTIR